MHSKSMEVVTAWSSEGAMNSRIQENPRSGFGSVPKQSRSLPHFELRRLVEFRRRSVRISIQRSGKVNQPSGWTTVLVMFHCRECLMRPEQHC